METKRLIPYVVVLLALAFALGSLPHGTSGGSLLFQSTWLLYLIYLGPLVLLGLMIALIFLIGMNWRTLGAGIGAQLALKRRVRKRRSKISVLISILVWGLVLAVLIRTPGTIFNPANSTATNTTEANIVGDSTPPPNPFLWGGIVPTLSNLIHNAWFDIAFLGLLVVGGLVLLESVRITFSEAREEGAQALVLRRIQGLEVVNKAIELLNDEAGGPRSRIIACYQKMLTAVSGLGAALPSNLTARELDTAIRATFALNGPATGELTRLFEEARYSLHEIDEPDAVKARACLESIAEELQFRLDEK